MRIVWQGNSTKARALETCTKANTELHGVKMSAVQYHHKERSKRNQSTTSPNLYTKMTTPHNKPKGRREKQAVKLVKYLNGVSKVLSMLAKEIGTAGTLDKEHEELMSKIGSEMLFHAKTYTFLTTTP